MKKQKLIFWISTSIIFLMEGVLVAFTSQSEMSIQGITSLGYPVYFVSMIAVFKVVGSLVLIIPKVSPRIKEWAYAGFGIDFLSAFISIWVVAGFNVGLLLPFIFMILLVLSYRSYHKLHSLNM
jgi:hypothetical protein